MFAKNKTHNVFFNKVRIWATKQALKYKMSKSAQFFPKLSKKQSENI